MFVTLRPVEITPPPFVELPIKPEKEFNPFGLPELIINPNLPPELTPTPGILIPVGLPTVDLEHDHTTKKKGLGMLLDRLF